MALTHSHYGQGAVWLQAKYIWIGSGGVWTLLTDQWVGTGGSYYHGYTRTAGPLTTVTVSPATHAFAQNDVLTYTANGSDADGLPVAIVPVWSISTHADSINSSTGEITIGTTPSALETVTATVGAISGQGTYSVT